MMPFLHARDPSSLLSGVLSTRLYLYCTTHCQPAHEFTTGKEWQDKQQWDEQGHDLNGPLWSSSRGKDCAWDNIKIPTTFSTVDLFLPSKGITAQPEYQDLYIVSTKRAQPSNTNKWETRVFTSLCIQLWSAATQAAEQDQPFHLLALDATWHQAGTLLAKEFWPCQSSRGTGETALPCRGATVLRASWSPWAFRWEEDTRPLPETLTHLEVWFF